MNKTVTINLAGMVFNIEENAYQILKNYLAAIKNKFKDEEGCDEIVADIEARLAELLKAKINDGKQVLVDEDINNAINVMGKPDDFEETAEQKAEQQYTGSNYRQNKTRRVFRDGDNKVLGGVCSGIASYFDTDPLWIRLALVVLFFGFGSGFLLYIILWIIIPEAKTTAEKLEMRGEPIDMHTISKTVKEEAEQLKNRVQNFGNDMSSSNVGSKLGNLLYTIFYGIFKIITKIVGVFFVMIGLCMFVAVLCIIFNLGQIFDLSVPGFFNAFAGHEFSLFFIKTGIVLCVGIPFVMLVYKGMKLILGIRGSYRWLNIAAGSLWFAGLVMCLYVFLSVVNDFSEETALKQQIPLQTQAADTLYITSNNNKPSSESVIDFGWDNDRWFINTTKQPNEWWGKARLRIITSENDSTYGFVVKSSRGVDKTNSAERAKNILYSYETAQDTLNLNKYFNFNGIDKYRNQEVEILIKLPKNKVVYLDKTLQDVLFDVENVNEILDEDMVSKYWQMTPNGLTCLSCTPEELMSKKVIEKEIIIDSDEDGEGKKMIKKEIIINDNEEDGHKKIIKKIHVNGKDEGIQIDTNGIEVNSKDAHIKISKEGIKVEEKKK